MGTVVHEELRDAGPPALGVLDRFVDLWRGALTASDVAAGCCIAAVVHDSDDPALLARADVLATTALAALEGAVVLCRARRDLVPLDQTAGVLGELLRPAPGPAAH